MGVLKSRPWRRASTWNRGYRAPATAHEIDDVLVAADVIVYFGDAESKIYQLDEWLPMLEELNQTTASRRPPPARHPVQIRAGALAQARRPLRYHLGGRGRLEQLHLGTPGMFDDVSLLISHIPSVCLDFLYLHPEKPIVLTDRRTDRQLLNDKSPISRVTPVLDTPNIGADAAVLTVAREIDEFADARIAMRTISARANPARHRQLASPPSSRSSSTAA